jgi:hypothetical protein
MKGSMADKFILCPQCGTRIEVTEAFSQQVEEKLRDEFNQRYKQEKEKLKMTLKKQAEDEFLVRLRDMEQELNQKAERLKEAQVKELQFLARQRELEEREHAFKLEMERRLADERASIRSEVLAKTAEEHRLKDAEKDKKVADLLKQIEELKHKAEQGSQQTQGEVLELELEQVLREAFRFDEIVPVPKGARGADVIQYVRSPSGSDGGSIIWESKRTRNWSDGWIQKLKEDQREVKANIAVIVSTALPKGLEHFGNLDGVWICEFSYAVELAAVLRAGMLELAHAQSAAVGKNEKMELVYAYLSGQEFRQRVSAIVESFVGMKEDLESEKRAMDKLWSKRERQLMNVIQNTSRMYGDLQGIIGSSLQSIPILELPHDGADDSHAS